MKAIIIDDELNSRKLLQTMLRDYCEGVAVVGMAADVAGGIDLVRAEAPDLVFLDIELPGGDGMAVLEAFPQPDFQVVFVTGYDAADLRALARGALAWVQKPVELGQLREVVAASRQALPTARIQLDLLKAEQDEVAFILSDQTKHERIEFADVVRIEANRTYATFHLLNGEVRLAAFPLRHYEAIFPRKMFFRVHRSHLVNVGQVQEVASGRGGLVLLKNGEEIPIAMRRKPEFLRFLKTGAPGK